MKKSTVIGIGVIAILALFAGTVYVDRPAPTSQEAPRSVEITLAIAGILSPRPISVADGTTAAELLRDVSASDDFTLVEKEYPGLGTLVESIDGKVNGTDGMYWTYSVNGAFAAVGADAYVLQHDDVVEWTFDEPEEN